MKKLQLRFNSGVVLENEHLLIRSDRLPFSPVKNWDVVIRYLVEQIEKYDAHRMFGQEFMMGLNWRWMIKD